MKSEAQVKSFSELLDTVLADAKAKHDGRMKAIETDRRDNTSTRWNAKRSNALTAQSAYRKEDVERNDFKELELLLRKAKTFAPLVDAGFMSAAEAMGTADKVNSSGIEKKHMEKAIQRLNQVNSDNEELKNLRDHPPRSYEEIHGQGRDWTRQESVHEHMEEQRRAEKHYDRIDTLTKCK